MLKVHMSGIDNIDSLIRNALLKEVEISSAGHLTHDGWGAIFATLQTNANCKLETLTLRAIRIDETAVDSLSIALRRHYSTLKSLILFCGIRDMTIGGWRALFQTLQDPHCRVEELNLASNNITNEVAAELANSLSNNRTLKNCTLATILMLPPRGESLSRLFFVIPTQHWSIWALVTITSMTRSVFPLQTC